MQCLINVGDMELQAGEDNVVHLKENGIEASHQFENEVETCKFVGEFLSSTDGPTDEFYEIFPDFA